MNKIASGFFEYCREHRSFHTEVILYMGIQWDIWVSYNLHVMENQLWKYFLNCVFNILKMVLQRRLLVTYLFFDSLKVDKC